MTIQSNASINQVRSSSVESKEGSAESHFELMQTLRSLSDTLSRLPGDSYVSQKNSQEAMLNSIQKAKNLIAYATDALNEMAASSETEDTSCSASSFGALMKAMSQLAIAVNSAEQAVLDQSSSKTANDALINDQFTTSSDIALDKAIETCKKIQEQQEKADKAKKQGKAANITLIAASAVASLFAGPEMLVITMSLIALQASGGLERGTDALAEELAKGPLGPLGAKIVADVIVTAIIILLTAGLSVGVSSYRAASATAEIAAATAAEEAGQMTTQQVSESTVELSTRTTAQIVNQAKDLSIAIGAGVLPMTGFFADLSEKIIEDQNLGGKTAMFVRIFVPLAGSAVTGAVSMKYMYGYTTAAGSTDPVIKTMTDTLAAGAEFYSTTTMKAIAETLVENLHTVLSSVVMIATLAGGTLEVVSSVESAIIYSCLAKQQKILGDTNAEVIYLKEVTELIRSQDGASFYSTLVQDMMSSLSDALAGSSIALMTLANELA